MVKLVLLTCLCFVTLPMWGQTGKVVVTVKNVQTKKGGELSAGIFEEANFPKVGKQLVGKVVAVSATEMQIVFDAVPAGDYGVVVFQDINRDKDLATNWVGYPTEPIGFSNDAKIQFGPPAFKDAKVHVESGKTLSVTLQLK